MRRKLADSKTLAHVVIFAARLFFFLFRSNRIEVQSQKCLLHTINTKLCTMTIIIIKCGYINWLHREMFNWWLWLIWWKAKVNKQIQSAQTNLTNESTKSLSLSHINQIGNSQQNHAIESKQTKHFQCFVHSHEHIWLINGKFHRRCNFHGENKIFVIYLANHNYSEFCHRLTHQRWRWFVFSWQPEVVNSKENHFKEHNHFTLL